MPLESLPPLRRGMDHGPRWNSLRWELLRTGAQSGFVNQALDEVLLASLAAGKREAVIRIWDWTHACAVLGRFQSVRNEIDEAAASELGIGLARRITGGGTMFIEPEGAITYSIYAPETLVKDLDFIESYEFFDSWAVDALRELGIEAWYRAVNDIASSHGKIAGAAQARRGGMVLHHTTMAYRMNIPLMLRVLRTGKERLSEKGIVSANKIVGPLSLQTDLSRADIIGAMTSSFARRFGLRESAPSVEEMGAALVLADEKFASDAWIRALP
jgi:lipoate-protein ligase A